MIAGANAVQIGTANFVDPFIWSKVLAGIHDYMQRHGVERLADLVGSLDTRAKDKEWISS
jgi:dihydroorotate dehydrogenase (NAD+) catalytic subunit